MVTNWEVKLRILAGNNFEMTFQKLINAVAVIDKNMYKMKNSISQYLLIFTAPWLS